MRIDRLLCELNIGSRSRVKEYLKKGLILVDGQKITKPDTKVDEKTAVICYGGRQYRYQPFVYYMMNKPAGVVSATTDAHDRTVLDVFAEKILQLQQEDIQKEDGTVSAIAGIPIKDIFPVGRLDKDTVGLLLLTNDGETAHRLLSPVKHVPKTYYVETDGNITGEMVQKLSNGLDIGEKALTKEAKVDLLSEKSCHLTITEGKFHQVKRMFSALGLKVLYLKRISMGSLVLDEGLLEGEIRELTEEEVADLC